MPHGKRSATSGNRRERSSRAGNRSRGTSPSPVRKARGGGLHEGIAPR
jgi:hypothetical protein